MNNPDTKLLLVPIETLKRELDSRLLLSLKLLKLSKKWKIIFGRVDLVGSYWRNKKNNNKFIYLSKGTVYSKSYYQKLLSKKGYYFLLDEEGAIFSKYIKEKSPRGGKNNDLIQYMSQIIFWGKEELKNYLERHKKYLTSEKYTVCGNPRFDLCKKKYHYFYHAISKNKINEEKNFIMIDSAFGGFNNIVDLKSQLDHWSKVKYEGDRGEVTPENWLEKNKPLYDFQSKLFPKFVEGIKFITNKLPNYEFLIRPHPIENINTWIDHFKDKKNVKISNKDTAVSKFINARLMIHNGCSTAVEASFSNIPSICFLPVYSDNYIQELPRDVSFLAKNNEELLEMVLRLYENKTDQDYQKNLRKIVKPHIDNTDYESSEKIAKLINNYDFNTVINFNYDFTLKGQLQKYLSEKMYSLLAKFYRKILKKNEEELTTKLKFKERDKIKFSSLLYDDVKVRINTFKEIDKDLPNINLKELKENLFELSLN